ncbi:P-loop containing nucleoside triphosphate hydrolase protein [Mariannaea sp. PMI_226]|nr:P-loop containing nucleoside triphosphate hydrolase protein [Mariannaea sp. PMI_226]
MAAADIPTGGHRNLLDIIDSLRAQGFSRYVDLPEIIVCGDQSAGKSSVLEAISTMPFPTKDSLCTRFATELVLRRGPEKSTKVFITPGEGRFDNVKEDLERWQPRASIDTDGLEAVTEEALEAMKCPVAQRFYNDILRIELTGPNQPHLTMVDLPGLFRTGNKEQSDADAETVRMMVEKYMARPRSIILAVVSAKSEYVLQDVTSMARDADPERLRTMGLITKPDTLPVGSESEAYWVRLAQNTEVELRLGWHVLRNRKFEERGSTLAQRDTTEKDFFSSGIWTVVNSSHCGVAALRIRLSSILKDQILSQLPSLVQDVENGIRECTERLDRLGPVRATQGQQLKYLLRVSEEYTSLMKQAIDGAYTDRFFGSRKKRDGYPMRLRAVVQNRLLDFRQEMLLNGQSQRITDSENESGDEEEISESPRIPRSQYVEDVARRLKFSKGRELPGLFNPLIVGDLFVEQCEPWRRIVSALVEDIVEAAHQTTQLVIQHVTANDVVIEVLKFVRESIEELRVELDAKATELLDSAMQHPITYNRQLTENVQKAQHQRIRNIFGSQRMNLNPVQFLFGSSTAVDYMEAYYKVAMNRFIDDISVLAIENCLIGKVSELFRPSKILEMATEDISRLAGETEESSVERKRLEDKRKILDTGLRGLKGLRHEGQFAQPAKWDSVLPEKETSKCGENTRPVEKAPATSYVNKADLPIVGYFERELPISSGTKVWTAEQSQSSQDDESDVPKPPMRMGKKKKEKKKRKGSVEELSYPEPEQF